MKQPARELLKRLGSKKAHVIGWRDMWAMATQKGGIKFHFVKNLCLTHYLQKVSFAKFCKYQ